MNSILTLENVGFAYGDKQVLNQINYSFESGKIYAIVGKSGSGKTTLLSVMSGLAEPTEGRILSRGEDLTACDKYAYRSKHIGVVFQSFNLLSKLTAAENVELSLEISMLNAHQRPDSKALYTRAYECLRKVGLGQEEAERRILKLSGGQQQRVAIARALSYNPECILADEPTGNLDEHTQAEIMSIFRRLADTGKCVIIVTHSSYVAGCADQRIELQEINHLQ